MAQTKAKGSTKNFRDSRSQRLGVKLFGGEKIKSGMIIIRHRGTKYHPGANTALASDDTIFALKDGVVVFENKKVKSLRQTHQRTFVSVR